MLNKQTLMASLAIATGLSMSPAFAETHSLRFATAAPPNTIWQQQFDQFAADVAEETGGNVKIEVFYNSQLGTEQAVLPQVMRGRIDMGAFSVASIADQLPEAYLVSMLFFYEDVATRSCILDTVRDDYRSLISSTGIHLLDWTEVGTGQLAGSKAYLTPDTVSGARMGVAANPISNAYWEKLGAFPTMTPASEAASNLSTGLIDIYPTIPVFYLFAGIAQVAPVLTRLDYVMSPATIVISQSVWDGLSEEDRAGFARALARHPAAERSAAFFAFEEAVLGMAQQKGVKVETPSDEQRAQWTAGIEDYYTETLNNVSEDGRAFWSKLLAARDNCKQ